MNEDVVVVVVAETGQAGRPGRSGFNYLPYRLERMNARLYSVLGHLLWNGRFITTECSLRNHENRIKQALLIDSN